MEHRPLIATSRFLKLGVGLAIVIVLNMFFVFSTALVYDRPEYENFCEDPQVKVIPQTENECVEVGGQWTEGRFVQKGLRSPSPVDVPVIETEQEGYCDADFTCRQDFDDARRIYEGNFFIVLVILGTLTLVASFVVSSVAVVAPALSFGGVLTLVIASIRYWRDMEDFLQVIILGVALVALIWVAARKFARSERDAQ